MGDITSSLRGSGDLGGFYLYRWRTVLELSSLGPREPFDLSPNSDRMGLDTGRRNVHRTFAKAWTVAGFAAAATARFFGSPFQSIAAAERREANRTRKRLRETKIVSLILSLSVCWQRHWRDAWRMVFSSDERNLAGQDSVPSH